MGLKKLAYVLLAVVGFGFVSNASLAKEAASTKTTDTESAASHTSETPTSEAKKKPAKTRIAHLELKGELPESPGQLTFFGDLGADLRKTIARIDRAAKDDQIAGLILDLDSLSLSRGKLNELREAIGRVRAEGKKVFAQLESATGTQFLLATACDEIIMPEAGILVISGVQAEVAYYKELLGKLGIEADMLHVGESKGAAEPLTRTSMSEPVRKNLTAMVDDLFDQMIITIATDRNLRVNEVRKLIDTGLITAIKANEAGLIDRIAYPDQLREQLKREYEAEEFVYVVNYGKKSVDTDFSGPMGMIKLFQQIIGAGSSSGSDKGPKIAVIYAVGPIMSGKSEDNPFTGQLMGSETIVKAINKAADDEQVKAIVLRIDSPGGSALASDLIWRATQTTDKPIVASMGDVAASGGYYIAMGADRILAEPGTITGSIGVVGGKLAMRGLFDKVGITTDKITRGENSGIFNSTDKFSDSERQVVETMMKDIYRLFTTKAAAGRGMPLEKLEALAGGQVYTGRDAKRNGLVDELGTLKDAIAAAKKLADIDADTETSLEILPEPENPFESLFGADLDKQREVSLLGGITQIAPELRSTLRHAHQLRQVMREPVALMMPFWIEVK